MGFSEQRSTNWGCVAAAIIVIPLALVIFLIGSMGGGGCEGAPDPCEGDYTPMWMMLGGLLLAGLVIAKIINLTVAWFRNRSSD